MTKDINITNPSQNVVKLFESMRRKKDQQAERLKELDKCTFSLKA